MCFLIYYYILSVILLSCGFYFFGRPRDKAFDEFVEKKMVLPEKSRKEAQFSPNPWNPVQAISEAMKASNQVNHTACTKPCPSYLEAVWWYLSSRHACSHELKPCSSRVQSAFHKELRTLEFSQVLYKENNISRVRERAESKKKKQRKRQRTQEAEIIQRLGD